MCQVRSFLFSLSLLLAVGTSTAQSITVLTHDSFSFPLELVERFTADTGIEVDFLSGGDAGQVVNRAILTKARPIADLLFGVDENLLERARDEQIFEPYHRVHETPGLPGSVGIGLTISRQLARLMDGSLDYRVEGGRSRFRLQLLAADG